MTFRHMADYSYFRVLPERQFIERVRRLAGAGTKGGIVRGIGDDCAILEINPGQQLLVTTDLCVEGVHFRRDWHPAESVGHRCLARGLSDIAAMGGRSIACFLSLAVPAKLPSRWANEFLRGLLRLARRYGVSLAGGDTSTSDKVTADIVVLGTVPKGKAVVRSGARAGDRIYVTGDLGSASAVLQRLYRGNKEPPARASKHFYPVPRVEIGRRLREQGLASAMIDISDGLSVDLAHLCEESSVSARIEASKIPVAKTSTLNLALHGGDEYELLFTARKSAKVPTRIGSVAITAIGEVLQRGRRSQIELTGSSGRTRLLAAKGWQHFNKI